MRTQPDDDKGLVSELGTSRAWRKSSYSATSECVELADHGDVIAMRNSNNISEGTLFVRRDIMSRLLAAVKSGELDHLGS